MGSLTPELARQNNADPNSPNGFIPEVNGVVITRVYPKTPAQSAGLRRLDVVVEIGGKEVTRADDAQHIIDGASIGENLTMRIFRSGKEMTLEVKPEVCIIFSYRTFAKSALLTIFLFIWPVFCNSFRILGSNFKR